MGLGDRAVDQDVRVDDGGGDVVLVCGEPAPRDGCEYAASSFRSMVTMLGLSTTSRGGIGCEDVGSWATAGPTPHRCSEMDAYSTPMLLAVSPDRHLDLAARVQISSRARGGGG